MDTEVPVKTEPMRLVEDEEENHLNAMNEAVLSANVCDEGNRMLKSDIDNEEACLLEDNSECNYSAEDMDNEVTVKPEPMWLLEDKEGNRAQVTDEGIVAAADCDEINEEMKPEIDIEEDCIVGDSSECIHLCKGAGDTSVLENEGIIISSTDKLQAVEGNMLEYEEHLTVNIDKKQERNINTKKYSRKVHKSFSECGITSESQFKCDICGKCFKRYSEIVRHINSHNLVKPVQCEVCNKCFTESGNLKRHMRTHTGEKPFKCKECSKCFTEYGHLKQHMRTHTGQKPFKCKECSRCFTQSSSLKIHMRMHTGEKQFKCEKCSKCFNQCGNLKRHLLAHTGEKPFKCKECSKCFTVSGSLKIHMRLHTGDKPFKCKECSKCFSVSHRLKDHIRRHTGEKPFKCIECSKCFTSSSSLKKHIGLYTGEKQFKCKQCSKCFTESSHLERHVRTHT